MLNKIGVLFLLCCFSGCLPKKQLPSYIQICKRDQNTINDCARRSIEALRPRLIEGLPELDVPAIEPFYIPEIVIVSGEQISLRAIGKDVRVTGAGNFTIKSLSVDLDTLTFRARVRFPKLHLEGRYSVDTQILIVPIKGKGTLKSDAVKCDAELVLRARTFERDGVEYIGFTRLDTDVSIKDYYIRLEGLFNGDPVLGEATNAAINENRGEFLRAVKPYLESTVSKLFLDIANKVAKDIPYDEVLPKP
ncbi:circadian clock-controlled protein daywake-like [Ostrinia nubilalis]|uniref:circadian clock-controlled protein-like n=1 Tax=Ostrinia furnacalis TaxID=93504 RepID=UPI00103C9398|nr:circadian clock-controlled protein-like [Ostrinia furnacalis]